MAAGARHAALGPAKSVQLSRAPAHVAVEDEVSGPRGSRSWEGAPAEASKKLDGQKGARRVVGSLALCDSPLGEEGGLDDILRRLAPADVKDLQAVAHKRSRRALRCLSYPALPPERERSRRAEGAKSALARAGRVPERVVEQRKAPALERALALRRDAMELRHKVIAAAQPLAEDLATDTCTAGGGSLDWVDLPELSRVVEVEAREAGTRHEDVTLGLSFSVPALAAASDERGAGDDPDQPVLLARGHPAFQRRHWPSMATFEQHYRPPVELEPPQRRPISGHEREPLPRGRRSIAGLEDTMSLGSQAYLWPDLLTYVGQDQAQPVNNTQRSQRPTGIFEAAAVYRTTCKELGVVPLERPVPIFSSERVEIADCGVDISTRQCYAIAKTIRCCSPREISLKNAYLTDMGCAEIVNVGIACGQLRTFRASGCWLGSRTCAALHSSLRTRAAASLTELRLAACGLGGDLEEDVSELETSTAAAYLRSKAALLGSENREDMDAGAEAPRQGSRGSADGGAAAKPADAAGEGTEQAKGEAKGEEEGEVAEEEAEGEEQSAPPEPMPLLLPLLAQLARPGCALRTLELSKSAVSLATATLLGKVLATTPLEALLLNHCNIQDDSLQALAEGLSQNRLLLELQLRGNKFSGLPTAPAALLDAAGRHARLAHLDIADNMLTQRCVDELCAALRWSCSLVAIHLLSLDLVIPDAPVITEAVRSWLAENTREADAQGRGPLEPMPATGDPSAVAAAAMASTAGSGTSPSPASKPAAPVEKEDPDAEPPAEELVLCRALHVERLGSWRLTLPAPKSGPVTLEALEDTERVPRSWMPWCCWVCNCCAPVDYRWVVPDCGEGCETGDRAARVFLRPSFADFSRVELKRQNVAGAKRVQYEARLLVPPGSHTHIFEAVIGSKTQVLYARGEPSVELSEAAITDTQRELLERLCRQHRCSVKLNLLARVEAAGFQIPESTTGETSPEATIGDWDDEPERRKRFRQCYEADLRELHLSDLCHAEEEEEVLETLWELYPRLYETYAVFAGRSQWPLVRHVDVYSFFDESRLLMRVGPLAALVPEDGSSAQVDDEDDMTLELQDVQQMILQTFAPVQRRRTGGRRRGSGAGTTATSGAGGSGAGSPAGGGAASTEGPGTPDALSSWAATVQQRTREGAPITRPQFIEVLLRAAIALCGGHPSTSLAFRKFADRVISGRVMQPPLAPFPRGVPLQAGEVADTLLARRKSLREAWERFGSSESAFQRLAQLMKLCDRSFTAKHVASIYAIARRPQADFRDMGRRSQGLKYDEFCEAVARFALVWQRTLRTDNTSAGGRRRWPPQPQVGRPVRQIAVAGRIEAFLAKLAERMRPSIMPSSIL